ncbi:hypothetical protein VTO42DRAFT_4334 [Malbranchea cinnamomea]
MQPSTILEQCPLGSSIPPNTSHAVSVSLPTWRANVGYEEGEDWVVGRMTTGYPRFFVHKSIQALVTEVLRRFGTSEEHATLFPSPKTAAICQQFLLSRLPPTDAAKVRAVHLVTLPRQKAGGQGEYSCSISSNNLAVSSRLSCVLYPKEHAKVAKQVWQHTGDGVSSRRAEFCLKALRDGNLAEETAACRSVETSQRLQKGPKRYQKSDPALTKGLTTPPSKPEKSSGDKEEGKGAAAAAAAAAVEEEEEEKKPALESGESAQFIEERFGRNLNSALADSAKLAVRRRIAGSLTASGELSEALKTESSPARVPGLTEDHVYLFPSGMSAIFNTHRILMAARGSNLKSICFGFPYIDTLKILEKWGPGALFYGNGESEDLDDLERRLKAGERFLALFTEFPGNPLLKAPDLARIRALANEYDFAVVVDESVGNFINVNVLPDADVVVSSLTKIFSGDSNVMGGSAVLNPSGRYYQLLRDTFAREYEDNYWAEDAIFLERNSRDFVSRIERINASTEALTAHLRESGIIKQLYYPKYNPSKTNYDRYRNPNGGYGGLFSITFHSQEAAVAFYDALDVMKGPSLGTNFTLSSPYTLLAHYGELEWAKSFGVESNLVRTSVGLEDFTELKERFQRAIDAAKRLDGTS